jgi:hypothetical protein
MVKIVLELETTNQDSYEINLVHIGRISDHARPLISTGFFRSLVAHLIMSFFRSIERNNERSLLPLNQHPTFIQLLTVQLCH